MVYDHQHQQTSANIYLSDSSAYFTSQNLPSQHATVITDHPLIEPQCLQPPSASNSNEIGWRADPRSWADNQQQPSDSIANKSRKKANKGLTN